MSLLSNLLPALIATFGAVAVGYVFGRCKWMSPNAGIGLSEFVGRVALPALLFSSMATLDLAKVEWSFFVAILLAKSITALLVVGASLVFERNHDNRFALAGIRAIFATQSNDFAFGLPILQALYGDTHPQFPALLYIVAPVSLLFINPACFMLCEASKSDTGDAKKGAKRRSRRVRLWRIIVSTLRNPVVFMTFLGVLTNLALWGNSAKVTLGAVRLLGSGFSSVALFLLGFSMVGRLGLTKNKAGTDQPIFWCIALVLAKTIVVSVLAMVIVQALSGNNVNLTMMTAIYGVLPTAPSVFIFAKQFGVERNIAFFQTVCTAASAPVLYTFASLAHFGFAPKDWMAAAKFVRLSAWTIGWLSMAGALLTCLFLLVDMRARKPRHRFPRAVLIILIAAAQFAFPFESTLCRFVEHFPTGRYMFVGNVVARIFSVMLAVEGLIRVRFPSTKRPHLWLQIVGWSLTTAIGVLFYWFGDTHHIPGLDADFNCFFQFGTGQSIISLVQNTAGILAIVTCVVWARKTCREIPSNGQAPLLESHSTQAATQGDEGEAFSVRVLVFLTFSCIAMFFEAAADMLLVINSQAHMFGSSFFFTWMGSFLSFASGLATFLIFGLAKFKFLKRLRKIPLLMRLVAWCRPSRSRNSSQDSVHFHDALSTVPASGFAMPDTALSSESELSTSWDSEFEEDSDPQSSEYDA